MKRLLLLMLLFSNAVLAQDWPTKPVRVIVPYPTGGGHDFASRLVAQRLADTLKQPFVVENRTGASGTIGAEYTAKSAPDGYTFMVASPAETVVGPFAGLKMNYDWEKDLVPVTLVMFSPYIFAVHPSVPVATLDELIAYDKANPGKLNVGTSGVGSIQHLTALVIAKKYGLKWGIVPYRGGAAA